MSAASGDAVETTSSADLRIRDHDRLQRLVAGILTAEKRVTAIPEAEAWERHVLDSLQGLDLIDVEAPGGIVDVGSGNGVPGIVVAIERPRRDVCLVEANGRKADGLERLVRELALPNVVVVRERAETIGASEHRDRHAIAVCRALAPPAVSLEYCLPLVMVGGCLVAWLGVVDRDRLDLVADELGARIELVRTVPGSERRHLVVVRKLNPTPAEFPRRAGMAAKRPLGSS